MCRMNIQDRIAVICDKLDNLPEGKYMSWEHPDYWDDQVYVFRDGPWFRIENSEGHVIREFGDADDVLSFVWGEL